MYIFVCTRTFTCFHEHIKITYHLCPQSHAHLPNALPMLSFFPKVTQVLKKETSVILLLMRLCSLTTMSISKKHLHWVVSLLLQPSPSHTSPQPKQLIATLVAQQLLLSTFHTFAYYPFLSYASSHGTLPMPAFLYKPL